MGVHSLMHLLEDLNKKQGITMIMATHVVDLVPLFMSKIAMEVRPGRRGSGVKVSDRLRMLGLPQEIVDGVETGIREGAFTGALGYSYNFV